MFDSISSDTFAAVLLIVVVFQIKRILVFFNLSKMRMRCSDWTPVLRARVPEYTRKLLESAQPGLVALGFELVGTQAYEPLNAFDPRPCKFDDFYWHPEKSILAVVQLAEPLSGQVTKVRFVTMFADGTVRETVNREAWAQLPVPDKITMGDAYADELDGQWQFHLQAVARESRARVAVTDRLAVMRRLGDIALPRWIARMRQLGWAKEVKETPGLHRFTPRGAWAYSGQLKRQPAEVRSALARPYRHTPVPDVTATRVAEMNNVAANIELAAQPLPSWIKAALFGGTLLLSILAFGRDFNPAAAAAVILVMLVHELGHFAAMWAFGYRNLSIFFLPFFGAAATGHKPHALPLQEAIVLLAGPVPGILLALAATQIPSDALPQAGVDFMREFVWFALVINLFNLLPFGVLDGGKLFELAVLGRFPRARAVFAMLGAIAGLVWAVSQGSHGLAVAMILVLWTTPFQFKAAKVIRAVRAAAKARGAGRLGKEDVIAVLAHEFARGDYGGTSGKGWTQRLNIATLAYPRLLQGIPRVSTSVAVPALQGLAFFGPLVLLVVWSLQRPEHEPLMRTTAAEQREIEQQASERRNSPEAKAAHADFMAHYAAEADPARKWAMLARYDEEEDAPTALELDPAWLEAERTALLPQLPQDHPGKVHYLLGKIDSGKPGAVDAILSVIAGLTGNGARKPGDLGEEPFELLMEAYRRLARVVTPDAAVAQMPLLDGLWLELETPGNTKAQHRAGLAATRAHMAFVVGRPEEAQVWMDRYVANSRPLGGYAAQVRGWFLLDIGHYDEALALAQHEIEAGKGKHNPGTDWQALAGWAEMGRGQPREADGYFQAALDEQAARMKEQPDGIPLWLRLVTKTSAVMTPRGERINRQTLDHLAALEGYDPEGAARLRSELSRDITPERRKSMSRILSFNSFDGWGKAREKAHQRILDTLNPVQNVAAAGS